jgi:hypothetical protein
VSTAPAFVANVLRWKQNRGRPVPNCADVGGASSLAIASAMYEAAGVVNEEPLLEEPGNLLERGVEAYLAAELVARDPYTPARHWVVDRRRLVADFHQYAHLATLQAIIERDTTATLSVEIGRDYLIKPDVTVGLPGPWPRPMLHAAVSCKWTMRSDRVQNIRHEGVILTRHRRGRQPHIVTVTVEPLPSRLASLARGTGEVDAVYHVLFDELVEATGRVGTPAQRAVLDELIGQRRLLPFADLVPALLV